jgi:hypothetical protein
MGRGAHQIDAWSARLDAHSSIDGVVSGRFPKG